MKCKIIKALFCIHFILALATFAIGQNSFKVWTECASGCDGPSYPKIIHFEYSNGLQITVGTNYPAGVNLTRDNFQTVTEFELNRNPTKYFANKLDGMKVNSVLNSILLKVFSVGEYCDDHNITGVYSETGRFAPLAELRRNLKIGSKIVTKKSFVSSKLRDTEISEDVLRRQMINNGLRSSLEGCTSTPVNIKPIKIDLNRDGQKDIIVTADSPCWGAHGMKTWIYQIADGKLIPILAVADGGYIPTNTSTRGFRDVTLSSGGYVDVYTKIYKYNGREYEYFISKRYQRNKSGKLILKETYK